MASNNVWLDYVIPSFGILLSTCLYSSPVITVRRILKQRSLLNVNPLPYPVALSNAVAWGIYGLLTRDRFIFWANMPGMLISGAWTFIAYRASYPMKSTPAATIAVMAGPPPETNGVADDAPIPLAQTRPTPSSRRLVRFVTRSRRILNTLGPVQTQMEIALLVLPALQILTLYIAAFLVTDDATREFLLGMHANVITTLMFSSPLSTIAFVLRRRDATSIDPRLTTVQLINCVVWSAYGLAQRLPFVYGCNLAGLLLALIQLALLLVFGPCRCGGGAAPRAAKQPSAFHKRMAGALFV